MLFFVTELAMTRICLNFGGGINTEGNWHLGGEKDDTVFFYSKSSQYLWFFNLARISFDGVVVVYEVDEGIAGGFLQLSVNSCSNNSTICNDFKYLRIFSNRRLAFKGASQSMGSPESLPLYINGTFGPPCPPTVVKLGRLD